MSDGEAAFFDASSALSRVDLATREYLGLLGYWIAGGEMIADLRNKLILRRKNKDEIR